MNPRTRYTNWPQGGGLFSNPVEKAHLQERRFHIGDRVIAGWVGIVGTVSEEIEIDGFRPHFRIMVTCDPGCRYVALEGAEYNFQPWED